MVLTLLINYSAVAIITFLLSLYLLLAYLWFLLF